MTNSKGQMLITIFLAQLWMKILANVFWTWKMRLTYYISQKLCAPTFLKCISYAKSNRNGIVVVWNSSQNDLQSRNQMKGRKSSSHRGRLLAFTIIAALAALISSNRSVAAPYSILQWLRNKMSHGFATIFCCGLFSYKCGRSASEADVAK